jgi:hypothetical protein
MSVLRRAAKRALLAASSWRQPVPGLRVLTYHTFPRDFSDHVQAVERVARIIDVDHLERCLQGDESWPSERTEVLITFDDGYRSLIEAGGIDAPDVLACRPVVFALAASVDDRFGIPQRLMMGDDDHPLATCDADDLRALAGAGWDIGCHTGSHWDCGDTDQERLRWQIRDSRDALEEAVGAPVRVFAYPWGKPSNASTAAREIVDATGYVAAFSTLRGVTRTRPDDVTFIRRDVVDDWWTARDVIGCLAGALDRWG